MQTPSQIQYLDMKDYIYAELKKKITKYNINKKDLMNIDPYVLNKYLNHNEKIRDITQFMRHLLQYTYRASINEVINEYELKEVNKNLQRIEKAIKKLLKHNNIEEEPEQPEQPQQPVETQPAIEAPPAVSSA